MAEKKGRRIKSIDELRLIDDICGSVFFQDKNCVEILLREVLDDKTVNIEKTETQKAVRNIFGRGGQLDVLAYDANHGLFDIEFQEGKPGATPDRAFFNYALLVQHRIATGTDYKDFPYIHIVFVLESNYFKFKKPVAKMRFFLGDQELCDLKLNILYVSASNPDTSTSLGKVLHDLLCDNPQEMLIPEFAERLRKIRDPLGKERKIMGKYSEMLQAEARAEGREEGAMKKTIAAVVNMLKKHYSYKDISEVAEITEEEVIQIANKNGLAY